MSTRERVYKLINSLDEEKLEALLLLFGNSTDDSGSNEADELMGIFSDSAGKASVSDEKSAWEKAVVKKHEDI